MRHPVVTLPGVALLAFLAADIGATDAPALTSVTPSVAVATALTLTIEGTGFHPAACVPEVYDPTGRQMAPGVVRERSATRLVAALALAGSGPGTYTVKVVNPDGLRSRGATVSLEAEVSVSPSSGPPGTTFTYSGRGFTGGFGATSRLRRPDGREFPAKRMPIRADGTFEDVIWSGEFVPGTYTVWATDDSTEVSTPPAIFLVTR